MPGVLAWYKEHAGVEAFPTVSPVSGFGQQDTCGPESAAAQIPNANVYFFDDRSLALDPWYLSSGGQTLDRACSSSSMFTP